MAKKKTKNDEDSIFDTVQSHVQTTSNSLKTKFQLYNELEDLYLGHQRPLVKGTTKSNVPDAMAFEVVESLSAHLFTQLPTGRYVPTEQGDTADTEIMNMLAKYQLERPAQNFNMKYQIFGKQMALYGIAWGVMLQRYEVNQKSEVIWNSPCIHNLNIYDVYPDLGAADPHSMNKFVFDEYLSFEELNAQNVEYKDENGKVGKRYGDLNWLKELTEGKNSVSTYANSYRGNLLMNYKIDTNDRHDGRILVRRFLSLDRWVTVLPDFAKVIEDKQCPYEMNQLPVFAFVDHIVPGSIIGQGEIEPVRGLITAMNQLQGMRFDNAKTIMERPITVLPSSFEYLNDYVWGRNKIWRMAKAGDVAPLDVPDTTGATYAQMNGAIEDKVARRLGKTDFLSRTESGNQNRTATEIKAMVGEQNARLRAKGENVDMAIRQMHVLLMKLNQQFMKKETMIRIVGEGTINNLLKMYPDRINRKNTDIAFISARPEDIAGEFDYLIETSSNKAGDLQTEVSAILGAVKMLSENKGLLQGEGIEIKIAPLLIEAINKMGIKNVDNIIKEVPNEEINTTADGTNPITDMYRSQFSPNAGGFTQ